MIPSQDGVTYMLPGYFVFNFVVYTAVQRKHNVYLELQINAYWNLYQCFTQTKDK